MWLLNGQPVRVPYSRLHYLLRLSVGVGACVPMANGVVCIVSLPLVTSLKPHGFALWLFITYISPQSDYELVGRPASRATAGLTEVVSVRLLAPGLFRGGGVLRTSVVVWAGYAFRPSAALALASP